MPSLSPSGNDHHGRTYIHKDMELNREELIFLE